MTILALDGFDMYNGVVTNTGLQAKWTVSATASVAMVTGRFGGQALRVTDGGAVAATRRSITATATIGIGVAIRASVLPTANAVRSNMVALLGAGASTFTLGLNCKT